jgi:serine/threonine-protein phosphatase 2A regulatory subunit B
VRPPCETYVTISRLYLDDVLELAAVYEEEEDPTNRSFFSEIISSISDVKFSRDGRYILARDYLSLRIWDVNMESRPLKTIQIHDHLRGKLCDLYENDCIFDKFECTWSGDDKYVPPFSHVCPS